MFAISAEMSWKDLWRHRCLKIDPDTLIAYLEGNLGEDAKREAAAHIDRCPTCQSFTKDYHSFMELQDAPPAEPTKQSGSSKA